MKLKEIKDMIAGLKVHRQSISETIKQFQDEIANLKQEKTRIAQLPLSLQDHVNHHKADTAKELDLLKKNVRAYLKGEPRYHEASALTEPRNLIRYLIPFGSKRSLGGAVVKLEWVLLVGTMDKLAALVEEELAKLEGFGTQDLEDRRKQTVSIENKIEQLEKAINELQGA